jgi:hypothetical protein
MLTNIRQVGGFLDSVIDVRDFPSFLARSFVRVAAILGQLLERLGLFERRQDFALQVLDEGNLHHFRVADDHWDFPQTDLHGGVVATFAGDDLVTVPALPYDERFDDSFFGDRSHQLRKVGRIRCDELPRGRGERRGLSNDRRVERLV